MKKLILMCSAILFFSAPLFGQNRLVDNAGLLNSSQANNLRELLDIVSETYKFDIVIVTEENIGNVEPMDYADDYFDYNGYGFGDNFDGCIFLQVTGIREYWFSTSGRGEKIFDNTAAGNKLENDMLKSIRKNDYYGAYLAYVKNWEKFLELDAKGRSYNFFNQNFAIMVIIAWVLSLLTGLIVVAAWKRGMNTARLKTNAASYILSDTLLFADKRDRFLYSTVTKTAKPKSTSSGSRGGSHTSSSGRSHGGRGGRY